jgi:hypothetical protein
MSIQQIPFRPSLGATVNIDVSSSSQSVSLVQGGRQNVRVMNNGTATAWITFGPSGTTASLTTSFPVGPGVIEVFTVEDIGAVLYASAIAAGSTGKIYFTPGNGF